MKAQTLVLFRTCTHLGVNFAIASNVVGFLVSIFHRVQVELKKERKELPMLKRALMSKTRKMQLRIRLDIGQKCGIVAFTVFMKKKLE